MVATPALSRVNESTVWGLSFAGHRFVQSNGRSKVEGARAHRRYLAVAPADLLPKLQASGLTCEVQQSQYTGKGQAIVTCTARSVQGGYAPQCHILLDHRGRSSVKLQGGVLRVCCANAFTEPAVRLHHCGEELRRFVEGPCPLVWNVINTARTTQSRVEALRGDLRGEWLLSALRNERPRLAERVAPLFDSYVGEDGLRPSSWAFVQACTAARGRNGRKVRSLESIASRVVDTLHRGAPVTPEVFSSAAFN